MRFPSQFLTVVAAVLSTALRIGAAAPDSDTAELLHSLANSSRLSVPASNTTNAATSDSESLRDSAEVLATTNLSSKALIVHEREEQKRELDYWQQKMELARRQRLERAFAHAKPTLVSVIEANTSDEMKRTALLELAIIAQEENDLSKAQQIFAHYLAKWPDDPSTPEVVLRQGLILRRMGLNNLALTKFYAVMTSSLVLKADKLDYYRRLVLQAQTEIAETYFQQGKFQESAEFFTRLLKLDSPLLNKPQLHFKLVRSLAAQNRFDEVTAQAYEFLDRYKEASEQPEVRFFLATALKQRGRNNESLQQVLALLQNQSGRAQSNPATWTYWQQRTGNEIANQLYKEGDYLRALEVYSSLASLNTNADWQLPVWYQMGLTYERLQQPAKAMGQYMQIMKREMAVSTNAAAGLRAVLDMARWRQQYVGWQTNTESMTREFKTARLITPEASSSKP